MVLFFLSLLFSDLSVAVGVLVFLNSLICDTSVVAFYMFLHEADDWQAEECKSF